MERWLLDENVPRSVVEALRGAADDVRWAADPDLRGASDDELILLAVDEDRILVTLDTDFGALAFQGRAAVCPGIVLFRLEQLAPRAAGHMTEFLQGEVAFRNFFTVVSPGQFRQAPLESS